MSVGGVEFTNGGSGGEDAGQISEDKMITSKSIASIALKAATLLATGKIDAITATWIGAATQRALNDLSAGKALEDKSTAALLEAKKT
jgi:hypothetical protein